MIIDQMGSQNSDAEGGKNGTVTMESELRTSRVNWVLEFCCVVEQSFFISSSSGAGKFNYFCCQ